MTIIAFTDHSVVDFIIEINTLYWISMSFNGWNHFFVFSLAFWNCHVFIFLFCWLHTVQCHDVTEENSVLLHFLFTLVLQSGHTVPFWIVQQVTGHEPSWCQISCCHESHWCWPAVSKKFQKQLNKQLKLKHAESRNSSMSNVPLASAAAKFWCSSHGSRVLVNLPAGLACAQFFQFVTCN